MSNYTPQYDEDWDRKATELYETTVLSRRQAQTYVLTKDGRSRYQIAELLDISPNTVDEHRQQLRKRIARAENTVRVLSKDAAEPSDDAAVGEEAAN